MVSYDRLWKLLIDKKIKKVDLRRNGILNSNQLTKLNKNEPVNLKILIKLCQYLGCQSVDEIMEIVPEDK